MIAKLLGGASNMIQLACSGPPGALRHVWSAGDRQAGDDDALHELLSTFRYFARAHEPAAPRHGMLQGGVMWLVRRNPTALDCALAAGWQGGHGMGDSKAPRYLHLSFGRENLAWLKLNPRPKAQAIFVISVTF